jgi:hypothetical protein
MAELTFKSPGVGTREIDLSGPTSAAPQGIPAGVIGTSLRGPAFVPVTVANFTDFVNKFGTTDGEKFGPLAMNEWLRTARAGTYVRVLGAGDGKTRTSNAGDNAGKVTNAGFVVGDRQVQADGDLGANPYALGDYTGRTFFLGCYMSESNGVTMFSEAGAQTSADSIPVLRGVIFAPSGVLPVLSSSGVASNDLPATAVPGTKYGFMTGTVKLSSGIQEFVLLLSGHKATATYPNIVTASFDPQAPNYFVEIFNTDPTKTEQAGHYLYTAYDAYRAYTVVTGTGNITNGDGGNVAGVSEEIAFILTGSQAFNTGSTTVPNFEGFEDRFQAALSPMVISQDFGGSPVDLFRVHALDDGVYANTKFKISISNIIPSTDPTSEYGSFSLTVRAFGDTDDSPQVLESYIGLTLNPTSERYFGKIIGDTKTYYDFDRAAGAQKLVVEGNYPNLSSYIRLEIPADVENQEIPADALPVGFRGVSYLNVSGSSQLTRIDNVKMLPVPMRRTIALGTGIGKTAASYFHWGVQFEVNNSADEPNKNTFTDSTVSSLTKYFSNYFTVSANPLTSVGADTYNNNLFSLTKVRVADTSSLTGYPKSESWPSAVYRRDGTLGAAAPARFINIDDFDDFGTRRYLKFSFFVQGGFNGTNVFNSDRDNLLTNAAAREMDFTATQGGPAGNTVAAYRKAIDVLADKAFADIQILAIPGIREPGITDYAIDAVTSRFDAIYIMDIEERNISDSVVTSSNDTVSVALTANGLKNRTLDTSFAAAYFPDIVMTDPVTQTNLVCPPSVVVLGAFAVNDSLAYPWFAPAGFTRGALSTVIETQTKLNRNNLDVLYSNDINPITTLPGSAVPVVYGQKTLLARSSALDRVNVRRLLIDLRRKVRNIANSILFEPNRAATLARFSALVDPILKQIQAQQGVDRYRVKIDTTTTTQADVENNTIRGKIFIQPTRSVEFISLDFVVSNPNVEI